MQQGILDPFFEELLTLALLKTVYPCKYQFGTARLVSLTCDEPMSTCHGIVSHQCMNVQKLHE